MGEQARANRATRPTALVCTFAHQSLMAQTLRACAIVAAYCHPLVVRPRGGC